MMNSAMVENRNGAIRIIEDRTNLRKIGYKELIDTFESTLERRTMNLINYIKHLSNLLKDDVVILNTYELEFIEEGDMKGYWKCEIIKSSIIQMMIELNELI